KTDIVVVSFDDVMESIPHYQQDKKNLGAEEAFGKWEICAREIGYELLFQAIANNYNVIFDNTGSRPDHVDFLTALKQQRIYTLRFLYFPISEELAMARAAKRERYLPPHYIPERRKKIEALLPSFKALADEYDEYISADQLMAVTA
ncbi:MAG TPA: zeta toxin family protein, partial [Alphaproteobacteria bacterium]